MSYTIQQLIALAAHFEKMAVDIPQPPEFDEDFKKPQKIIDPKPENDDAYQAWLKDTGPLDEEIPVEVKEPEMTHEEWEKKNPRMSDWSDEDWQTYLDKGKSSKKASLKNTDSLLTKYVK